MSVLVIVERVQLCTCTCILLIFSDSILNLLLLFVAVKLPSGAFILKLALSRPDCIMQFVLI